MTTQKFVCPIDGNPNKGLKEINIPISCLICGHILEVIHSQTGGFSGFRTACSHFYRYDQVWKNQILASEEKSNQELQISPSQPIIEYGINCKKCNEYNPYAERKDNFICYGCRSWS